MKDELPLTAAQIEQILQVVDAWYDRKKVEDQRVDCFSESNESTDYGAKRGPGRPRSKYKGQLHLHVLKEDELWFKEQARKFDMQNGRFFSHLRKVFELHSGENAKASFSEILDLIADSMRIEPKS